ncbi:AAA family ATPase [Hamadaea tsunoensis]|uniref:AAA family ATPase n=1 Tax=Hamadaea tsunoensis TaxID=53368 RepID=UPI000412F19A|nr:helix-turn-helix transcriptional regulator [Hamadaea tsunoensis]
MHGRLESPPVGRASVVDEVRARLTDAGGVVVVGPAGIGKSTVLDAYAATAGARVLRATAENEPGLPYLTLVDLFDGVVGRDLAGLPGHLRAAFEGALLRGELPAAAQDQLAVRLAVLTVLRRLAGTQPILLVVDDLQWVDAPSADVLRFVARRVNDAPIRMLAAERVEPGRTAMHLDLVPAPAVELALAPLTEYDVADVLRERFGPVLALNTIARVHEASQGNPLLAVELGRALIARGGPITHTEPLPVPDRLRPLIAQRLASLPAESRPGLLRAAAAARPTTALVGDLRPAYEAGLVVVEPDGFVRFAHPLLREQVYADAAAGERAAAHEELARLLDDPVERARHMALATQGPDSGLACRLAEAAEVALRRGAPAVAAELAERAADRTPADEAPEAAARRYAAAQHAYAAGLNADTLRLAEAALAGAGDAKVNVGARLLLVDLAGQDQSGTGRLLDAAFTAAGDDPGLLAKVRLYQSLKAYYDGDLGEAEQHLKLAEADAGAAGDVDLLIEALAGRAHLHGPLGVKDPDDLLERAAYLARGRTPTPEVVRARQLYAMACVFSGEVDRAVRDVEALRLAVQRTGTVRDLSSVLTTVASIYSRAGKGGPALRAGRECMRLFVDMEATPGPGLMVGALVELMAGTWSRAARLADETIEACRAAGDEDWLRPAYATRGQVHLYLGEPEAAAASMRMAYALEQRFARVDPVVFLWHADFVEALAATGARDEAQAILDDITAIAEDYGRDVVRLGFARARAVLTAVDGDARTAATELAAALAQDAGHPYPMEIARAWHALAGLERRAHRRAAARAALTEAVDRYAAIGAAPWLESARADLARLDGAPAAGLSPTEQRIVDLLLAGATNREIAAALYLSLKAVEANLTRLYRRYSVRGRAQLIGVLGPEPAAR